MGEVKLYIDNEQVAACEKIKISTNIAELKNVDYNGDFIAAFRSRVGGKTNLTVEEPTTMKRYILLGCERFSSYANFPREDYYSDYFQLKFETIKKEGWVMNIEEAIAKKEDLEHEIAQRLNTFMRETGLTIESMGVRRTLKVTGRNDEISIILDVRL